MPAAAAGELLSEAAFADIAIGGVGGTLGGEALIAGGFGAGAGIGGAIVSGVSNFFSPANLARTAAGFAFNTLVGAALGSKPKASTQQQATAQGALINSVSNIEPIPVIYGSRRCGGSRILTEVSGASNEFLHLIIVWGEGAISAVQQLYLDGVAVSDARFSGLVSYTNYLGTDVQTADATLIAALGDGAKWSSACTLSGIAYTYLRLTWDQTAFATGLPNVTADIDGRTLYDPRDASTAFSRNPILAIRDYLTNTRYGRSVPTSMIDDTVVGDSADHCEETVSTPAGSQDRYTCDGLVNPDDAPMDSLRALLTSCRGYLVFSGGQYKPRCDRTTSSTTFALTEDNILGAWSFAMGSKRSRFNRVKAQFFDPDQQWQPNLAIQDSAAFRTTDNELLLESQISLPFTADAYTASQIAQVELKQSRFGIVVSLTATIAATQLEVGDVVPITHSTPGWTAKAFRVIEIELLNTDEVRLTLREYDASVYTLDTIATINTAPSTNLPDPTRVSVPQNVALSSGTTELFVAGDGSVFSRIKVAWTGPADIFVLNGGAIEAQFKKSADSVWMKAPDADANLGALWLSPVDDGVAYDVRIRSRNRITAVSAWVQPAAHTVIGKTALPSDITLFTIEGTKLSWSTVSDADLAGYRLRVQPGTSRSWGDAIWLHGTGDTQDVVTNSPFDMLVKPSGAVTLMVKAVDTSGNESQNAAYIVTDLGDPIVANVVETFDLKAAGFTGTKTSCSVSGGNLVADVVAAPFAWNANDQANAWSADSATLAWDSSTAQYAAMTYLDTLGIVAALSGSTLTIASTIAGSPWTIEYRENSPKLAWSADSTTLAWSADSSTLAWDQPDYQPWPGQITVLNSIYDFRFSVGAGTTQGAISELTFTVDAPDVDETVNDVSIGAGGARLTLTKTFNTIKNVQLTVQNDGGTAITARTEDKSTAGPLIKCLDAAGSATTGLVDARVQGY